MMGDEGKSREQLVEELAQMRRYLAALEGSKGTRGSTEDALWEGGEYYRLLVESVKDYAIFAIGTDGRIASWNPGAEHVFGYREEEIVGQHSSLLFTPEDVRRGAHEEELGKAADEGRAEDERWHVRKEGSRRWTSGIVTPVRDSAGGLRGFAKVARDLTERKQAEEEIKRLNEERFEVIVESVKDYAIFMLDPEGRVTTWNEGARRIKGYRTEEIVGEHFSIFYLPEDIERGHPGEVLRRAVEEGSYEEERLRVRKDGSRFWASVVITALREEGGDLRGFAKVVRDVTERKRSEETLRWQAELLELSHEPILARELGGDIVYWNRGCEELYGFPEEEVLGRDGHWLLQTVHPVPLEQVEATLERAGRWAGELEHTTRDGRRVIVESRQALVHVAGGRRLVQETNRDITDRRRAEEALRGIREAERHRIARDLHDIVLQDLSGALQTLQLARLRAGRLGSDLDDLEEEIEALRRAATGLRNAVYDLRREDERPLVRAVEALVSSERRRAPEREIDLSVQEGFPQELAGTVGTELLRVIREALTNVRRHSDSRLTEVSLGAEEGQVRIEVVDDGRGFDPGDTSETPGGGAGLPGMRERVEALGGLFEIRARPGEGVRVTARVPF